MNNDALRMSDEEFTKAAAPVQGALLALGKAPAWTRRSQNS